MSKLVVLSVIILLFSVCVHANLIDNVLEKACGTQLTYPITSVQSLLQQLQQTQDVHEQQFVLHNFISKENSVSFHWSNITAISSLFGESGRNEVLEVLLNRMARLDTQSLIQLVQKLAVDYVDRLSLLDKTKNLLNDLTNENKNLILSKLFSTADSNVIRKYASQVLDFTPNCVFGNVKEDNILFMITNYHDQISTKLVNNSDVTRYAAIKQVLSKTLSTLKPTQRFDILFVGYFYESINSKLVHATKENIESTIAKIESFNKESGSYDCIMLRQFENFGFPSLVRDCNYQQIQSSAIYYLGMTDDYGDAQMTADLIKKKNVMKIPIHTVAFELGTGKYENERYKNLVSRNLNLIALENKGNFIRLETK